MFCTKCGAVIGGENIYCHTCGSRIIQFPEEFAEVQEAAEPEPEEPVGEEVFMAIEALEAALPPEQRTIMITKGKKEKEYFGLPALIFCLTIIGILSAICGVLVTLYFGGF
jgi:hypothetical protein